jgi:hypothetical protein
MRRLRAHRHELVVVPLAVANCVLSLLLPCMLVFRLEVGGWLAGWVIWQCPCSDSIGPLLCKDECKGW